jgi:hypothetical protein
MDICLEHLRQYEREGDEFLDYIAKADKSWCLYYDPETKHTNQQWQHPSYPPPKSCTILSTGKVMPMLTLFYDHCEPLLIEWLPKGITVNADRLGETLEYLMSTIKKKKSYETWHVNACHHSLP